MQDSFWFEDDEALKVISQNLQEDKDKVLFWKFPRWSFVIFLYLLSIKT